MSFFSPRKIDGGLYGKLSIFVSPSPALVLSHTPHSPKWALSTLPFSRDVLFQHHSAVECWVEIRPRRVRVTSWGSVHSEIAHQGQWHKAKDDTFPAPGISKVLYVGLLCTHADSRTQAQWVRGSGLRLEGCVNPNPGTHCLPAWHPVFGLGLNCLLYCHNPKDCEICPPHLAHHPLRMNHWVI